MLAAKFRIEMRGWKQVSKEKVAIIKGGGDWSRDQGVQRGNGKEWSYLPHTAAARAQGSHHSRLQKGCLYRSTPKGAAI